NDSMLGLVANNYVRVNHLLTANPPTFDAAGKCTTTTTVGAQSSVTIDAAILALKHSFLVDNFGCPKNAGSPSLGTLTVNGSIAQKYRGPVASGPPGAVTTGFVKSYNYDDRFPS